MSDAVRVLSFTSTPDEMADVSVRHSRRSAALKAMLRRNYWISAGAFALMVVLMGGSTSDLGSVGWLALSLVGLVGGVLFSTLYYRGHEGRLRKACRRVVAEMYGDGPIPCEVRILPQRVWIRQSHTEYAWDWQNATDVVDTADGLELWFKEGLLVIRNRAFSGEGERREVLAQVRDLARRGPPADRA